MHVDTLIIIFLKNLEEGRVKTRLASSVGNRIALLIYKDMVHYTINVVRESHLNFVLAFSEKIPKKTEASFTCTVQNGKDLGERIRNAIAEGLKAGYKNILVIGSDCMELKATDLTEAIIALKTSDLVIGPSNDGGYYLIGAKKIYPELFVNKSWSKGSLLKESLDAAHRSGLKYQLLTTRSDVDELKDLPEYMRSQYLAYKH